MTLDDEPNDDYDCCQICNLTYSRRMYSYNEIKNVCTDCQYQQKKN
jgi:hypothetical protein